MCRLFVASYFLTKFCTSMKHIFSLILICIVFYIVSFQRSVADGFRYERIDFAYLGCLAHNSVIAAYSNAGILTISYDDGKSWRRIVVGAENESIIGMSSDDILFAGITNSRRTIVSRDNAHNWKAINLPETMPKASAIAVFNTQICIAAGASLYFFDAEMQPQDSATPEADAKIETLAYWKGILYAGGSGGKLWQFDASTRKLLKTSDLSVAGMCSGCPAPTNVALARDTLYAQIAGKLTASSDGGSTWLPLAALAGPFVAGESGVYVTKTQAIIPAYLYFIPITSKLEGGVLARQTIEGTERFNSFAFFTGMAMKGSDSIIGVGYSNTIMLSPNAGKTWKTISNFPYFTKFDLGYSQWLDDSTGFISRIESGRIYRTTDGGTTWLPQYFNPDAHQNNLYISPFCFEKSGVGFVKKVFRDATDTVFYTKDFGETYHSIPKNAPNMEINFSPAAFRFSDAIVIISSYKYFGFGFAVLKYDTLFNFIVQKKYDSLLISSLWRNGDTLWSWMINYRVQPSFQLAYSIDKGFNWEIAEEYINDRAALKSFIPEYMDDLKIMINGKYIICARNEGIQRKEANIYVYDMERRAWLQDTLNISGGTIYYLLTLGNQILLSHSYWDVIGSRMLYCSTPETISSMKAANTPGSLLGGIGYAKNANVAYYFNNTEDGLINVYRMTYDSAMVVAGVSETKTEESRNSVYAFPPYPNPARKAVHATVYWDRSLDFNPSDCEVYNAYGGLVERGEHITLQSSSDYNGTLIWDCSGLPAGAYYIRIRHGNVSTSVPVLMLGE